MSEEPTDTDASLLNTSAIAVFISYFDCLDKDLTFLTATEPAVLDKNKVAKHGQWTVKYIVRHETHMRIEETPLFSGYPNEYIDGSSTMVICNLTTCPPLKAVNFALHMYESYH
ncbi:hypothetical protein GE21DRAFT_4818 [Neurospora crassa]|uniref:Uncharacterized protein n=1 Tax=Neurospora crassa (strain ATCC 24698 / 74-OR23-1A / CBS 708.71 / DSM 1257 / FGSC 987) TaxID=367110 RepID=Q7RWU2_NEUCR|nr:hypothetical protein NCU00485 [Neurospora crassa OR74A]EAA26934.3 hypothetical protein NCU00485 [Neurospora crassa OR74A]KHE79915.1 hypothetical protein GE21DRAFT_4818 [Neurospora crassa]|eukprot:XP_956170.3 hypothetical protein NCU00485 [Neurospora crassa OR74A]